MATNETDGVGAGGEEIPMTGGNDTTDQTGDQETSFGGKDDLLDDSEFEKREELLYGDAFSESLYDVREDERDEHAGNTDWKMTLLADLRNKESLLSDVFGKDFRGAYGPANRKLLKSLRGTKTGLEFTNLDVTPAKGSRSYKPVIVGKTVGEGPRRAGSGTSGKFAKFNGLIEKAKAESDEYSARSEVERLANEDIVRERVKKAKREEDVRREKARKDRAKANESDRRKDELPKKQSEEKAAHEVSEKVTADQLKKDRVEFKKMQNVRLGIIVEIANAREKEANATKVAKEKTDKVNGLVGEEREKAIVEVEKAETERVNATEAVTEANAKHERYVKEMAEKFPKLVEEIRVNAEQSRKNSLLQQAKEESDRKKRGEKFRGKQKKEREDVNEEARKDEVQAAKSEKEVSAPTVEGDSTSGAVPVTKEVVDEVLEGTGHSLEDVMLNKSIDLEESLKKLIRSGDIGANDQIVREIAAVTELQLFTKAMPLDEKLILYDANIKYWKELSVREGTKANLKELYEKVAELDGLAKDSVRVRARMKPEMEIAREILKEKIDGSDTLRLERFKRWAKKNMVGLSTGAITVAAFVTSIVMAARAALRVGAQGVGRFAKAVGNILKKMGPIFSALGTVISTALSWGAKGVAWLASNLWILAIAVAYALYNGYISRRNAPTPQIPYQNYPQTGLRRVRNYM